MIRLSQILAVFTRELYLAELGSRAREEGLPVVELISACTLDTLLPRLTSVSASACARMMKTGGRAARVVMVVRSRQLSERGASFSWHTAAESGRRRRRHLLSASRRQKGAKPRAACAWRTTRLDTPAYTEIEHQQLPARPVLRGIQTKRVALNHQMHRSALPMLGPHLSGEVDRASAEFPPHRSAALRVHHACVRVAGRACSAPSCLHKLQLSA